MLYEHTNEPQVFLQYVEVKHANAGTKYQCLRHGFRVFEMLTR